MPINETVITNNMNDNFISFRLEEFPHEMILSILEYCDPRTKVNLICTSKRLRILTIQLLLSGKDRHEYRLEGISIRNHSPRLDFATNMIGLSHQELESYLEVLMGLDDLEMDRLNLTCCSNLKISQLNKIPKFMNKFNRIGELILLQSEETITWIDNNVNSLKYLSKLTLVELEGNFQYFIPRTKSMTVPIVQLKVLHGIYFVAKTDVNNFSKMPYFTSIEELSVIVECTIFEYCFHLLLEKCANLRELNITIIVSKFTPNNFNTTLNVNEELVQIMRSAKKLETLRLDSYYDRTFTVNKLAETDGIFPNLKIYSNHMPTADSSHHPTLIPHHKLKGVTLHRLKSDVTFPDCDTCYLNQSTSIPNINCRKLVLFDEIISLSDKGLSEMMSTITDLREVNICNTNIQCKEQILTNYKTGIERLVIEKSTIDLNVIVLLVQNSPNLKELQLKKVNVIRIPLLPESYTFKQSKLRLLHFIDCYGTYSAMLEQLLSEFNFPHLESIVLENSYSVTKEILNRLILQAPNISSLNVSGVGFNNDLIGKFLDCNKYKCRKYGIDLSFNGKEITLDYLGNLEVITRVTTLSLPDCIVDNNEMINFLDKMARQKLLKLQINLGNSGPTIELLKKVQEFTELQMIYLNGNPEKKIEGFESFVLEEFLISMPNIRLLYLESGAFSREDIENAKNTIRLFGRSAPKLLVPMKMVSSSVVEKQQASCILN